MTFWKRGLVIKKKKTVHRHIRYVGRNRLYLVIEVIKWIFKTVTFQPQHLGPVIDIISTIYFTGILFGHKQGDAIMA